MVKLKNVAMYFDGGSWHIRTTNGEFVVENGFGELIGAEYDEKGKLIKGEFYNPNKGILYAGGHPGNKSPKVKVANQKQVNDVLGCMIRSLGLSASVKGVISKEKYEMINDICNFIQRKSRHKRLKKYSRYPRD